MTNPPDQGYEYPYGHPRHAELKAMRDRADVLYKEISSAEEASREAYKHAMGYLVEMGEQRMKSHEHLKELGRLMMDIEALASKPTI